ncbi:MAG TPA: hypothetical protein DCF65_06685, partial [Chloroflexi bacterium]|nr:hypothetical protein [Chloroflexota bacterium]
ESIRRHLSADQFKLYDLIWRRFVASRMAPAVYDQTQAEIEGGEYIFSCLLYTSPSPRDRQKSQ